MERGLVTARRRASVRAALSREARSASSRSRAESSIPTRLTRLPQPPPPIRACAFLGLPHARASSACALPRTLCSAKRPGQGSHRGSLASRQCISPCGRAASSSMPSAPYSPALLSSPASESPRLIPPAHASASSSPNRPPPAGNGPPAQAKRHRPSHPHDCGREQGEHYLGLRPLMMHMKSAAAAVASQMALACIPSGDAHEIT